MKNIQNMNLKELQILQAQVEEQIEIATIQSREDVLIQISQLAEDAGFTLSELIGKRGKGKGKISVAKYQDPDNPAYTWTGRGRKPNWLLERVGQGFEPEDFEIRK